MLVLLMMALMTTVHAAPQIEIDRVLERVQGTPIMTSDIRQARLLKLFGPAVDGDPAIQTAIENRLLMLTEVTRAGVAEPTAEQIAAKRREWRAQFATDLDVATLLARAGMTDKILDGWFRDDIRLAAQLDQRFGATQDDRRTQRIAVWIGDLRRRANLSVK